MRRKTLIKDLKRLKSTTPNPKYSRLEYVRYADDWVVGVWGSKQQVIDLKSKIDSFLHSLKLSLSLEKTLITNTREEQAKFLGTLIFRGNRNHCKRTASGALHLSAPLAEIVKRLKEKKFLKKRDDGLIPDFPNILRALPVKELILRYRTILSGILNFYSFADNKLQLKKIYYILHSSLSRGIIRKEDLSQKEFEVKYGKNIELKILKRNGEMVTLDFKCPALRLTPMKFLGNWNFKDPLALKDWKISTLSAMDQNCANCNSSHDIEMHHVKHIKTINTNLNSFDKMMARINRKQVPLCRDCHLKVHSGNYCGMSLRHFRFIKWEGEAKWS